MESTKTDRSLLRRLAVPLGALLDRVQPSGEIVAVSTSLLVGLGTGLAAVAFNLLIQTFTGLSFSTLPDAAGGARWTLVAVPALGGLLVGPLIYLFAREAKGHGVPEVMQAIALRGGRIRPVVAVVKAITASITIGTGGSVGREGPIVQIGSALGSTIGQLFHLSEERIRNLVACGAAGGIAATFNAPIAGVIFAVEVILGELSANHAGTIIISAVTASATMDLILGSEYAFPVPEPYALETVWEFGLYAVFGVLAALVAAAFVRTLYAAEDFFDHQKLIPGWLQPAVGGLLLGGLALVYPRLFPALAYDRIPQVFGGGYAPIANALAGREVIATALLLLVLKMIATNLTLGSGGSGGVFAPSLFMGAMAGAAFGQVANQLFPGVVAPPGAYALVGMGAVFAGSAHAPITAVVMLFELTGDYRIILPLMLTIVIAMLVSRRLLGGESIYTLKLTRRGVRLQRGRDVDVLQSVRVGEIASDTFSVPASMTLVELSERFAAVRRRGLPVIGEDRQLWGIVTISDLERAIADDRPYGTPVTEIGTPYGRMLLAYPDETMGAALSRMSTRGLSHLPVVSREDSRRLVGMVRLEDVMRAYNIALTRRAEVAQRTRRLQTQYHDGTEFVDVRLADDSPVVGSTLRQIASCLPDDCILVSVQRNGMTMIPHGDTRFEAGDLVTAFVKSEDLGALNDCLVGGRALAP